MRRTAIAPTTGTTDHSKSSWIDPQALMRIMSLQLRAKAVVEGFMSGLHRSPHHGFSVEFTEYRQYTQGDDLRYLDWRLYARSDRFYLKRFEDETNLRCYLLVDLSRSMMFGSMEFTKAEYARTAAATLAYFLVQQRDAVGALTFDRDITSYLPARYRTGHLRRLLLCLDQPVGGTSTDITRPLEHMARIAHKRGLIVLLSDLLTSVDGLERHLGYLRSRGHEVVVFRILDPAEVDFHFQDPSMFVDLESGRELYVDPSTARASYQQRFQEHTQQIQQSCSNLGIDLFDVRTDSPLEQVLFYFLQLRARRGRRVARQGGRGWAR